MQDYNNKKLTRRGFRASPRVTIPTIVILLLTFLLILLPNRFENPAYAQFETIKAKVLSVDNNYIRQRGPILTGEQICEVRILGGSRRGENVEAVNMLAGKLESDKVFVPGDTALVLLSKTSADGGFSKATIVDYYRLPYELLLAGLFIALLIGFAGWLGLRSILSFVFTVLAVFKVLIPLLLSGVNAIAVSFFITSLTTTVIIVLVYGLTREFAAATMGTMLGVGFTVALSVIFTKLFRIHGAIMPYSESLLYAGFGGLDLTSVFIGSVYLASSGALTDIAVDITSAVKEVVEKKRDISTIAAIRSGLYIGRNAIGTMTTTLLLAYTGGYIGMLMVFVGQGTPLMYVVNLNTISGEILNTILGSFGLVTTAPFTAFVAGILLTRRKANSAPPIQRQSGTDRQSGEHRQF